MVALCSPTTFGITPQDYESVVVPNGCTMLSYKEDYQKKVNYLGRSA